MAATGIGDADVRSHIADGNRVTSQKPVLSAHVVDAVKVVGDVHHIGVGIFLGNLLIQFRVEVRIAGGSK